MMTIVESIASTVFSLGWKNGSSHEENLRRQQEGMAETLQELERVKLDRDVLKSKVEELEEASERQEEAIRIAHRMKTSMKATISHIRRKANDECARLQSQNGNMYQQLQGLKDEYLQSMNRQAEMSRLLETRTLELKGAQTFLTTVDSHSGNDVIGMVERLNTEIFQTAAFMADSFGDDYISDSQDASEDVMELLEWAKSMFGDKMVQLLRSSDHNEDPILIQNALQASMVNWSCQVISSWCFWVPDLQFHLNVIQESVRLTGEYLTLPS
jgi:hypothetical protein